MIPIVCGGARPTYVAATTNCYFLMSQKTLQKKGKKGPLQKVP